MYNICSFVSTGVMMIEPRIPKGFRDSLPAQEKTRKHFERLLEGVFESYGFVPIDTPAVEYAEVLLGKGGGETDKQIFRFTDNGGRDVALRFDLTVPLARFVSAHADELRFPFKRYQIAKVFRGEKPQKGRYREFVQCDFDIVGADSAASDCEILSIMARALQTLGIEGFEIRISHRGLLNAFLEKAGLAGAKDGTLRAVDKLGKIGREGVEAELSALGLDEGRIEALFRFIHPRSEAYMDVLDELCSLIGERPPAARRMEEIHAILAAEGIEPLFRFDPSITRGLDYYTGVVFETFLLAMPQIGSVCSGGRYDNLSSLYSKRALPGVGSCVGIDRLIAAAEELGTLQSRAGDVDVAILPSEGTDAASAAAFAAALRREGLACDLYLGSGKTRDRYAYAESKGARLAVLGIEDGLAEVKDLGTRETRKRLTPEMIASMAAKD